MTRGRPRVLHVEDDETLAAELSALLTVAGFEVASSPHPTRDPVGLVTAIGPDLIVTDVTMPVMSGFDFIATLRSNPRLRSIPVIFYTTIGSPDARALGRSLGAVAYLIKFETPLNAVVTCVANILRNRNPRD